MARPARFTDEQIVDATASVVAALGPGSATMGQIASSLGGPTGSIYHRFPSREVLLGEVWLRAAEEFQRDYAEILAGTDADAAGLAAALFVPRFVRERPQSARILMLHRREDFLGDAWLQSTKDRATRLGDSLRRGLRGYCTRQFGSTQAELMRIATYALAEAPLAAVRPHLQAGESPPDVIDAIIEATYRAAMALGHTLLDRKRAR